MDQLIPSAESARVEGQLRKLEIELSDTSMADYRLRAGEQRISLNAMVGGRIRLRHTGAIHCVHCGRSTRKSFAQGYCYPCFKGLAQCDLCIVRPETCHYFQGTCREPEWGEQHCFRPHIVYLANSSGLKVGITRGTNTPSRWLDQGAIQALPILEVETRQQSGLVETLFKSHVSDRTNWRVMLKGEALPLDLLAERERLLAAVEPGLNALRQRYGDSAIRSLEPEAPLAIDYPVAEWPRKITSFNLDKTPQIEGTLIGLKGQYLMLDGGVINLRKFSGYQVEVEMLAA